MNERKKDGRKEWMNEHSLSKAWHIFTSTHSPVEQKSIADSVSLTM